jgi:peptide/nickel transport system ATP-binding protein
MSALLRLHGLRVAYRGGVDVLADIDAVLAAGECLAVLGESGSGKSTLARAVLGLLPAGATCSGELDFDGESLHAPAVQARLRGRAIALVFQDAAANLHPLRRIGVQLDEALRRAAAARSRAEALREVGLPTDAEFARRYPHQLSGGQRQRVMIALALAADPRLLIADEITSALDPLAARAILDLLADLRQRRGLALLFISHDLAAVRAIADRVLLLHGGRVDCCVDAATFFARPASDYTRHLLAQVARGEAPPAREGPAIVRVRALAAEHGRHPALRAIDFELPRGGALGVIGASGSGKSTLARVLLALHRGRAELLEIAGADPFALRGPARKAWRRRVQIVFQDPGSALDPRMSVAETLREPLQLHGLGDAQAQAAQVEALLAAVQLDAALATRRPHELSGGQKQRVAIARALALAPEVLVCDEAVSALDVSVQAEILALLRRLQHERGLSLIFISHDLAAVRSLCDRIVVLEHGRIVEHGTTAQVLSAPVHPHTRNLVATLQ